MRKKLLLILIFLIIILILLLLFLEIKLKNSNQNMNMKLFQNLEIQTKNTTQTIFDEYNKTQKEKLEAIAKIYKEDILNGADPEVIEGMIPIYYENGQWKKADINSSWYSYKDLNWANVAIPANEKKNYYESASPGTIINEDEIIGYFVWVPRFEYKLFNVNFEKIAEQMIEVNFVSSIADKKTKIENGIFFTHPAFTANFNDKTVELNGFWIAKFEPSINNDHIEIKPNKHTLVNINTGKMIEYANSISTYNNLQYDSRIITNMEWGAIAYLSQSNYGKENNSDYKGISKKIFLNTAMGNSETWDNVTTGCSSGVTASGGTLNCPYSYDKKYYGTGASSTGNIYGIYDLAGGSWECVMGIISDYPVKDDIGGFVGKLPIDKRYYTLYKNGNMYDYSRGLIGDATRETLSSTIENKSWNGNLAYFATKSYPWIKRGGTFRGGTFSGIFDYGITDALPRGDKTFRTILSKY